MRRGTAMEQDIAGCLEYRMTWSARHIATEASWLEQAAGAAGEKGGQDG